MGISSLTMPDRTALTSVPAGAKQSKAAAAAEQFEALLIGQMLKSERESSEDGWMGGGEDSSAESAYGIAENQFAQAIASRGGFGLAKTIQLELESRVHNPEDSKSGLKK
jgi:Rod binding domain-containing protein